MIVRWGSRTIAVFFNEKAVEKEQKNYNAYIVGFANKEKDEIYIRTKITKVLQRITLWHELSHLCYDSLSTLSDESLVEINARFVDEVFIRNVWVRKLYEKEKK